MTDITSLGAAETGRGIDSGALMGLLDGRLHLSRGAACDGAQERPDHVAAALDLPPERRLSCLRISWDASTSKAALVEALGWEGEVHPISAGTHEGTEALCQAVMQALEARREGWEASYEEGEEPGA